MQRELPTITLRGVCQNPFLAVLVEPIFTLFAKNIIPVLGGDLFQLAPDAHHGIGICQFRSPRCRIEALGQVVTITKFSRLTTQFALSCWPVLCHSCLSIRKAREVAHPQIDSI